MTFAGGRGVGVLEFVVANATDQVAVDMATAALAFFAGSALFRAQLRECEPALRELERFRDLGAYRSPTLQKRPAAFILQKLAQEYCESAAAAAALADVVQCEVFAAACMLVAGALLPPQGRHRFRLPLQRRCRDAGRWGLRQRYRGGLPVSHVHVP